VRDVLSGAGVIVLLVSLFLAAVGATAFIVMIRRGATAEPPHPPDPD
jgi:hypothetical protein